MHVLVRSLHTAPGTAHKGRPHKIINNWGPLLRQSCRGRETAKGPDSVYKFCCHYVQPRVETSR